MVDNEKGREWLNLNDDSDKYIEKGGEIMKDVDDNGTHLPVKAARRGGFMKHDVSMGNYLNNCPMNVYANNVVINTGPRQVSTLETLVMIVMLDTLANGKLSEMLALLLKLLQL